MTTSATIIDPRVSLRQHEQEDHCRTILSDLITEDSPIDAGTARIIAACLHDGPDTALSRFAATGALHLTDSLTELARIRVPEEQTDWVIALWEHLEHRDDAAPDSAEPERR